MYLQNSNWIPEIEVIGEHVYIGNVEILDEDGNRTDRTISLELLNIRKEVLNK